MKRLTITIALMLCSLSAAQTPKGGYIPNEQTAIAVAEAILVPNFGSEKAVQGAGPYTAALNGKLWTVCTKTPKRPPNSEYGPVGPYCIQFDKTTAAVYRQMPGK